MKYKILNIGAWIVLTAVVVSGITRRGSTADTRSQTFVIAASSAPMLASVAAAPVEESGSETAPADTANLVADNEADDSPAKPESIALNDSGAVLLAQGKPEKAVPYFEKSIDLDPNYARAYYNLGVAQDRLNHIKDAIAAYERAISLRPNYYRALFNLGLLYYNIASYEDAQMWLKKATEVKRSEEVAGAWYTLGLTYKHLGNVQSAANAYKEALRLKPGFAEPRYSLAQSLMEQNKYEDAAKEFERTAALGLKKKKLYTNLGVCYSRIGKHEEAVGAYRKALDLEPNDAKGWFNLAVGLGRLDKTEEAKQAYVKSVQLDDNYYEAHFNLALLYADQKRFDSAVAEYRRTVMLNPSFSKAHFNLGLIYLDTNMVDSAVAHFTSASELDPENLRAIFNLGVAYSHKEDYPNAAATYRKLLDQDPTNTKGLNNLGTAFMKLKQYDSALVYLNRLVGLAHSPEAYFNRAIAREELDSVTLAIQDYRKAIDIKADYAKAYHNCGILEDRQGNHAEAIKMLEKAIELDPASWRSHWKLGQLYLAGGQTEKAKAQYAAAAEHNADSDKFKREYQDLMQGH